jgi:hypothetical protein
MPFLLFRYLLWNLLLLWWVYVYILFIISLIQPSIFFVFYACGFNYNMLWGSSILVKSVWCFGCFLYLNGPIFLKTWEIFCYYFIECIMYPIGNSCPSMPMILRFVLLMELLSCCIFLSQLLSCLTKISSAFFYLISILSPSSEILSPTFSGLLVDLP